MTLMERLGLTRNGKTQMLLTHEQRLDRLDSKVNWILRILAIAVALGLIDLGRGVLL